MRGFERSCFGGVLLTLLSYFVYRCGRDWTSGSFGRLLWRSLGSLVGVRMRRSARVSACGVCTIKILKIYLTGFCGVTGGVLESAPKINAKGLGLRLVLFSSF